MDRTKSQFARLQALDAAIRQGSYPNCLGFSVDWEVSQKTIQRDIEFLKYSLGAPIEYDRGKQGYYYSDNNWFLPALNISEGELFALMLGAQAFSMYHGTPLSGTLRRILDKIRSSLPDVVSVAPDDIAHEISFVGFPTRPIDPDIWRTVVHAVRTRFSLQVTYRAEAKTLSKGYEIHPYHLANLRGDWYLLAAIPPHTGITQFALSRFERASVTAKSFAPPDPEAIQKRLGETFGQFVRTGAERMFRVRVAFTRDIACRITARPWHPAQKLKQNATGGGTLEFPAASLEEVMRWVLGWGRHMKVQAPPHLAALVDEEVAAMGETYPHHSSG